MAVSDLSQFPKTARCGVTNAVHAICASGKVCIFLLLAMLAVVPQAKAQLPDAPSASLIAPLKRFSLNVTLDDKYSLKNGTYDLTPRLGMGIRLGERETLGIAFSRAIDINKPHEQSDAVLVGMNFRLCSWGKIPRDE